MRYSIALLVVTAFNLANAGLGWLLLRQAGPDLYNVAQLLLGVSGAAAGGWALSLLLRLSAKPADEE
jgi:hypothetical protein